METGLERATEDITGLQPGDRHYKAFVGPPEKYDLVSAMQFNLLTACGLRDQHTLLDIGCGSLRSGKLLIPYLRRGHYFGIEPNAWLIEDGITNEVGRDLVRIKEPRFDHAEDFRLSVFGERFDFLLAQSIFSHTTQAQVRACLQEARQVLKPGGLFLATFVLGKKDYTGTEWVYPGCVRFTAGWVEGVAAEHGFRAIRTKWAHPNGQTWYVLAHESDRAKAEGIVRDLFRVNRVERFWKDMLRGSPILYNGLTRSIYRALKPAQNG